MAEALIAVLHERGARTVSIGSSRDAAARGLADYVASAWSARRGTVLVRLDWPERAASWLRPAGRFVAGSPDAWIVCARPDGWLGMGRRLLAGTDWDPRRTVCAPSLDDERLLAEPGFAGLSGVGIDGGTWRIGRGVIVRQATQVDVSTSDVEVRGTAGEQRA